MNLLKNLKKYLLLIGIYIFAFELIFQIFFFFDFKFITKPDLYYNGYCDQKYWNLNTNIINFKNDTLYHPKLSFIKKGVEIPEESTNYQETIKRDFLKDELSFYGSSYINHNEFKKIIKNYKNIKSKNYALESYGLDQIYLSYKLTAHLNQNKTIIFGFLLEDLDRSIFYKREYQKAVFIKKNNSFKIQNVPVVQKESSSRKLDFYLYRFISNFYNLTKNNFDPRLYKCKSKLKKDLFSFFIDDIKKTANIYNQKIIIITFNLKEDLIKEPSWRYNFIKNYLIDNSVRHIDAYKILKDKSQNNINEIDNLFGLDKHNNEKSFKYIVDELIKNYKAM
jgi:hypothetical protein